MEVIQKVHLLLLHLFCLFLFHLHLKIQSRLGQEVFMQELIKVILEVIVVVILYLVHRQK